MRNLDAVPGEMIKPWSHNETSFFLLLLLKYPAGGTQASKVYNSW